MSLVFKFSIILIHNILSQVQISKYALPGIYSVVCIWNYHLTTSVPLYSHNKEHIGLLKYY